MDLRKEFAKQLGPARFRPREKVPTSEGDVVSIRVRGHALRVNKTRLEAEQVIAGRLSKGWELISDTRVGRMGGVLTFRRVR